MTHSTLTLDSHRLLPKLLSRPLPGLLNRLLAILLLSTVLASCAQLKQQAEVVKPTASLTGASLKSINFDQADLEFDLAVENKNPVSLDLAGLDYDFKLEDQSVVSGITEQGMKLKANSTSPVSLPISLKFEDLKKLGGDIWEQDTLKYDLQTTFKVKLPVIGDYPIPVSKTGEIPVPKMPKIKLKGVKLKEMGFTSADVVAQVEIRNPNDFRLGLNRLDYKLAINNTNWGSGKIRQPTSIPSKGKAVVDIPLSLDLLSMGSAAMSLIKDKADLEYKLTGNANIDTGLELLKNVDVPLDLTGTTNFK